ncbi:MULTISPECIES: hypothetical protein [unclassified Pseudomonas]|uniref:hypothetical protein n=1 Tax=unclassified Pseudomonas TaxID=196821 RepID=UPI0015B52726|nr:MULTISPECIES: hypothetical protein [unclassified Pseudomonas]
MNDDFLELNDLDWFAVFNDGLLAHFATGGRGVVPEMIRESISNYEMAYDYFYSLSDSCEYEVVEENVPVFNTEAQRDRYVQSFAIMARKGLFSYDICDFGYKLIALPKKGRKSSELPLGIKEVLYRIPAKCFDNDIKCIKIPLGDVGGL